jgi:hypothetical protein
VKYDLHKPCNGCPFLKVGGAKHLGKKRAREIAMAMASSQGATFSCHKTVDYSDDEPLDTEGTQHCAGALLFMEKVNPAGTQIVRIMERLGAYDRRQYSGADPVFDSVKEMVAAHAI